MEKLYFQHIFKWKHLIENPTSIVDVEKIVKRGSVPDFPFFFMLAVSAIVAPPGLITQQFIDDARDEISEMLRKPFVAELGVIIESVIRSTTEDTPSIIQSRGSTGIPD